MLGFETGSPIAQFSCARKAQLGYVARDDFEFLILVSLPPECWDYTCAPPCLVYIVLRIKPWAVVVVKMVGVSTPP